MKIQSGLLWYDNRASVSFDRKVMEASEAYTRRFGRAPDTCCVNPSDLPELGEPLAGIAIEAATIVRPHHFLVGVSGRRR